MPARVVSGEGGCLHAVSWTWARLVSSATDYYYQARGTALSLFEGDGLDKLDAAGEVWVLGRRYGGDSAADGAPAAAPAAASLKREVAAALQGIPWFTYRHHFEVIPTSPYTGDSGWGCMLRTGQMLLACTLLRHYLGSSWRYEEGEPTHAMYGQVMGWFCDVPSAPYSIHNICLVGQDLGDVRVGHWFGPGFVSHVLQRLVNDGANAHAPTAPGALRVYVSHHTTVYRNEVEALCALTPAAPTADCEGSAEGAPPDAPEWCAVLILIPVLLGLREFNAVYHGPLLRCLQFPQFVGLLGGRPRYSLYLVGAIGHRLLYRDPHALVQAALTSLDTAPGRLHSPAVRTLSLSHLDPSMALGFYCRTREEFEDFVVRARELGAGGPTPVFSVEDRPRRCDGLTEDEPDDMELSALMLLEGTSPPAAKG